MLLELYFVLKTLGLIKIKRKKTSSDQMRRLEIQVSSFFCICLKEVKNMVCLILIGIIVASYVLLNILRVIFKAYIGILSFFWYAFVIGTIFWVLFLAFI